MLGKERTGVMGRGAKSGRGLGNCRGAKDVGNDRGLGLGYRRGNPNFSADTTASKTQKESLKEQKS